MASFTPKSQNWHWYQNNAAEPTLQLSNENVKPTLANTNIIRLRHTILETGGKAANSATIALQYSTDGASFTAFGAGNHWDLAAGAAAGGGTIVGFLDTDSNSKGPYLETGSTTASFPASLALEIDVAIQQTGTALASQLYYFRVTVNGTAVPLNTAETYPQVTTMAGSTLKKPTSNTERLVEAINYKKTTLNKMAKSIKDYSCLFERGLSIKTSPSTLYALTGTDDGTWNQGAFNTQIYTGSKFTATATGTVASVTMRVKAVGSPSFTIAASIWSYDSTGNGAPSAQIGNEGTSISTVGWSSSAWQNVTLNVGSGASITSGTVYWVVIRIISGTYDNINYWQYSGHTGSSLYWRAYSGSPISWTSYSTSFPLIMTVSSTGGTSSVVLNSSFKWWIKEIEDVKEVIKRVFKIRKVIAEIVRVTNEVVDYLRTVRRRPTTEVERVTNESVKRRETLRRRLTTEVERSVEVTKRTRTLRRRITTEVERAVEVLKRLRFVKVAEVLRFVETRLFKKRRIMRVGTEVVRVTNETVKRIKRITPRVAEVLRFVEALKLPRTPLFYDSFEAGGAVNLAAYDGWSGTNSANLITSSTQAYIGTYSLYESGTASKTCYHAWTYAGAQSNTKVTVDFWMYLTACSAGKVNPIIIPSNGSYAPATTSTWPEVIEITNSGGIYYICYNNGGLHTTIASMSLNVWTHIEVQYNLDLATDTIELWVNGAYYGPYNTTNNGNSLAGISFASPGSAAGTTFYIDKLGAYQGARYTFGLNFIKLIAEVLNLVDVLKRVVTLRRKSATEVERVTNESVKRKSGMRRRPNTEMEDVVDANKRPRTLRRRLTDALNLSDTNKRPRSLRRRIADIVRVTNETIKRLRLIKVAEILNLVDANKRSRTLRRRLTTEIENLVEVTKRPRTLRRIKVEAEDIVETRKNRLVKRRKVSDVLDMLDATRRAKGIVKRITGEIIDIIDSRIRKYKRIYIISEVERLIETIKRRTTIRRKLLELEYAEEATIRRRKMRRVLIEVEHALDLMLRRTRSLRRRISETENLVDVNIRHRARSRFVSEVLHVVYVTAKKLVTKQFNIVEETMNIEDITPLHMNLLRKVILEVLNIILTISVPPTWKEPFESDADRNLSGYNDWVGQSTANLFISSNKSNHGIRSLRITK